MLVLCTMIVCKMLHMLIHLRVLISRALITIDHLFEESNNDTTGFSCICADGYHQFYKITISIGFAVTSVNSRRLGLSLGFFNLIDCSCLVYAHCSKHTTSFHPQLLF